MKIHSGRTDHRCRCLKKAIGYYDTIKELRLSHDIALESFMKIKIDDLSGGEVLELLEEHLSDMYATSPPGSVHALDPKSLRAPEITFFSGWNGDELLGCVAIKELTSTHVELKSMRTSSAARKQGIASRLLNHVLSIAIERGYATISLETGSQDYFQPARKLYEKHGFNYCAPFGEYKSDPNSKFMTRELVG